MAAMTWPKNTKQSKGLFTWRWGPQVGEVPCLGGATNLSFFLDCSHMRGGVPHLGGLPGQPSQVTRLGGVSFLHVSAEGGVG